jgi:hypothetical protein
MLSIAAVLIIDQETLAAIPAFERSLSWFKRHRRERLKYPVIQEYEHCHDLLLSLVPKQRLESLLKSLFAEEEFMAPYGIRSLSKQHKKPYQIKINDENYAIQYAPAESPIYLFGGNSNWRGPVWFPINYLFITALRTYDRYYGDAFRFANPISKNKAWTLGQWSEEISRRLISLFRKNENGDRPIHRQHAAAYRDPYFDQLILFYEYFHADNGRGVGASHQTGWTGLVANLIAEEIVAPENK